MNAVRGPFLFSVGGHAVAVEGPESLFFAGHPAFARFATSGKPQWSVRYGCQLPPVPAHSELLSSLVLGETNGQCTLHLCGDEYIYSMYSSDASPLLQMRHRRGGGKVEATSAIDPCILRFSLWFAVSMLFVPSLCCFVHASAVVCDGRAVLFLGESGTGKSTHSRLWLQNIDDCRLLNDDSPLVEVCAMHHGAQAAPSIGLDGVLVHGTPWSGKTPCHVPRSFPLAAVVRLSQASHNTIRRLTVPEAFAAIQPSLPPALAQDAYFSDYLIRTASAVISAVPVYHLQCRPDAEAARLCHNTVFLSHDV